VNGASARAFAAPTAADGRLAALLVAALSLIMLFVYAETGRTMAGIWQSSDTFGHGFFVVPIALWLVWRRRSELARLPIAPFWPGVLLVAVAGFVWMLGRLGAARVVEHFALVLMLQGAVVAVLGVRVARAVAFPLLFLLFAVPFGDAFVPYLIEWTADATVLALKLTGVPVYREGNNFAIPSGQWSVIDACSGIRYLVASLMAGALFAYLMYVSVWRRTAFIAASVVVPIVANWLRAYLIVMVGHLSSNTLAAGIDHLVYGWVFFGIVLGAMFWVGAAFRQDGARQVSRAGPPNEATRSTGRAPILGAALAAAFASVPWPLFSAALTATAADAAARELPPVDGANGWRRVADGHAFEWQPNFAGPRASLRQVFERDGERVAVYVAYYAVQIDGAELVSSRNGLTTAAESKWREVSSTRVTVQGGDGSLPARVATIVGARGRFDVLWWYWVGEVVTTSESLATARIAWSRLTRQPDDAAAVFLFTEPSERADGERTLRRFAADMSGAIAHALAAARDRARR